MKDDSLWGLSTNNQVITLPNKKSGVIIIIIISQE